MKYPFDITFQKKILKYLIQEKDIRILDNLKQEMFDSSQLKDIMDFIQKHVAEKGNIPSYETVQLQCGSSYCLPMEEYPPYKKSIVETVREIEGLHISPREIQSVLYDFISAQFMRKLLVEMNDDFNKGKYPINRYIEKMLDLVSSNGLKKQRTFTDVAQVILNPPKIISTGFPNLDTMVKGVEPSRIWVVGGHTSTGKTNFVLNIAFNLLLKENPVTILTTEMSEQEIKKRLLIMMSGINPTLKKTNSLDDVQKKLIETTASQADTLPLDIHEVNTLSQAHSYIRLKKSKLYIVDFLQQLGCSAHGENEVKRLGHITSQLARCAREYEVCVVTISQVSRAEKDSLYSFGYRGSGEIEEDVDLALKIVPDIDTTRDFQRSNHDNYVKIQQVKVMKNRCYFCDWTQVFKVKFDHKTMRMEEFVQDYSKDEID